MNGLPAGISAPPLMAAARVAAGVTSLTCQLPTSRAGQYRCISVSLLRLQHEDFVGPGFSAPDFALAARELSHAGVAVG